MLMVISPAKTLDYTTLPRTDRYTQPDYLDHSTELIEVLRGHSPAEIGQLMGISDQLAVLNAGRFATWSRPFTPGQSKQAVLAFMGDVYEGLNANDLDEEELDYLQQHLRVLSGLYGVLRPLDLIQPYRLEMGTRLANPRGKNLYEFWGNIVTDALRQRLAEAKVPVLVNLASEEYFKAVKPKQLEVPVITPVFQDRKNGQYKIISFYAKRARGLMARWATKHRVTEPEKLKAFNVEGYAYDAESSDARHWVFRRDPAAL